jgi:hypothetical protein
LSDLLLFDLLGRDLRLSLMVEARLDLVRVEVLLAADGFLAGALGCLDVGRLHVAAIGPGNLEGREIAESRALFISY